MNSRFFYGLLIGLGLLWAYHLIAVPHGAPNLAVIRFGYDPASSGAPLQAGAALTPDDLHPQGVYFTSYGANPGR